jgi:hypothetical protein
MRQGSAQEETGGTSAHFITVASPAPHEGVGRALRSVYDPPSPGLPDDINALMERLNRL